MQPLGTQASTGVTAMMSPQLDVPASDAGQQTQTAMAEQPVPEQQPLVSVQTLPLEHTPLSTTTPASWEYVEHFGRDCAHGQEPEQHPRRRIWKADSYVCAKVRHAGREH